MLVAPFFEDFNFAFTLQNCEICYWEYNWREDFEATRKEGTCVWRVCDLCHLDCIVQMVSTHWYWPHQFCLLQDYRWLYRGPGKIDWGRLEISFCHLSRIKHVNGCFRPRISKHQLIPFKGSIQFYIFFAAFGFSL